MVVGVVLGQQKQEGGFIRSFFRIGLMRWKLGYLQFTKLCLRWIIWSLWSAV